VKLTKLGFDQMMKHHPEQRIIRSTRKAKASPLELRLNFTVSVNPCQV